MPTANESDRQRLLGKLVRELLRSEARAAEHAGREARRIGETPPVLALREVGVHATGARPRLQHALTAHRLPGTAHGFGATLGTLRDLVVDRVQDAERAFRGALLDLRHGLDIVRVLREVARLEEQFALIRWCDDWLPARRTLVARVAAQLAWFADAPKPGIAAEPEAGPTDRGA
ncbi:MAG TPA: hypothetical protein VMJ10_09900 [Kofleriaceae bacterium]|nr:hypothetical protein [Kofleriaceae bacterium]